MTKLSEQTTIDYVGMGRQPSGQLVYDPAIAQRAGAPRGNKNAWKHGFHSKQAIAQRQQAKRILIESKGYLKSLYGNDEVASFLSNNH